MNAFNALRVLASLAFVTAIAWAGIIDWPGCPVWQLVFSGNAYWLWEMLILFVGWDGVLRWIDRLERRFRCATPI
jgi:hypothetical protein